LLQPAFGLAQAAAVAAENQRLLVEMPGLMGRLV
jgi:hypothetical protein